nr:hypothetical protein [Tanacetum cinerariifolium]
MDKDVAANSDDVLYHQDSCDCLYHQNGSRGTISNDFGFEFDSAPEDSLELLFNLLELLSGSFLLPTLSPFVGTVAFDFGFDFDSDPADSLELLLGAFSVTQVSKKEGMFKRSSGVSDVHCLTNCCNQSKRSTCDKLDQKHQQEMLEEPIWILEAIPATHVYVSKEPREKILRAFAWKMILPFSWARCRTLFVGDNLSPPLETLIPTKSWSESDWWKTSLEYFEGKDVQSEAVSEQLEIEKDALSEECRRRRKGRETVSSLQGNISILESRLLALKGDARISTLTQTVSSSQGTIDNLKSRLLALEGTIDNLESRLLALEGDERDFRVVSDGDIPTYMSPGPSYTSPASTAKKSLPLANRRKLRVRRTPLKLKSPMRCYSRKMRCSKPLPASTTMPPVTTILVPMTTMK